MTRRSIITILLLTLFLFIEVILLHAQREWCLDCGIEICTAPDFQLNPKIIKSGQGKAIIVWDDNRSGEYDVYAQGIDFDGNILWRINGNQACSTSTSFAQTQCQLTSDGEGGAIIVWNESRPGPPHPVGAQRIDANGDTLWSYDGVVVGEGQSSNSLPQLISDGEGGAIVTWVKNLDIYAQRLNDIGDTLWLPAVPICDTTGYQTSPQIASDSAGGAIIVWEDPRNGNFDVYAQRINANGDTLWPRNGIAICDTIGDQKLPQIIADSFGGVIITWQDYRNGNYDVYAQRVGSTGEVLWTPNGEVICDALGDQRHPEIVQDESGGAIITWQDCRIGANICPDVYAQRINADGNTLWIPNGAPVCTATGSQHVPHLTSVGAGNVVITWSDERSGGAEIYAQRLDGNGNPMWVINGITVCDASGLGGPYRPIPDDNGGAIIVWQDFRNGNWDIYARRVYNDGSFCPPILVRPRSLWHYTFEEPDSGWTLVCPDSSWDSGYAPFGNTPDSTFGPINPDADLGTYWPADPAHDSLWVCKCFTVTDPRDWCLYYGVDNGARIYLNGILVADTLILEPHEFNYDWFPPVPLDDSLFHEGENVICALLQNTIDFTAFDLILTNCYNMLTSVGDISESHMLPTTQLYQNYPNPFNPTTTIKYDLHVPSIVNLRIYNVRGRLVRVMIPPTWKDAGLHIERWDGLNEKGEQVSSGIYFYRLNAGDKVLTKKMVLLK